MPLAGSHERPASRPDVSSQRRKPLVDRASRPQGQNGSSANPPPSRGRGAHNDSDSSDSSDSVTSKDRRARHVRQTRPKTARAAKARAHVGTESASSSNTDSLLPTLGRLLQGRPGQEPNTRLTTSSTGSRSNQRPHQRHASTRSGRIARHHHQTTQAEIQTKLRSLVSPSLQSVLSSLTATTSSSSGSNGSTSTVTQSSYTKSEVSKETVTSTEHRDERLQSTAKKRRQLRDGSSEQPNVFAFMEEDSTHNARVLPSQPSSESDDDGPSRPQTPAIRAHRSSADPFVSPKPQQPIRVASWQSQDQLHSDSGISVRGSSPESIGRRKSIRQAGFEQTSQDMQTKTEGFTAAAQEHIRAAASWQRRWSNASVASQNPSTDLHQQVSGSQPAAIMPYAAPPPAYPGQLIYPEHGSIASPGERKASGYDLLASRLSEPQREGQINISSLYRRFSRLNHRILLHLQDEIAEMEEQLQSLDQSIAHTKPSPSSPESRRSEARYHSDLTYQRTELLGRIFMKIKQYSKGSMILGRCSSLANRPQMRQSHHTMVRLQTASRRRRKTSIAIGTL